MQFTFLCFIGFLLQPWDFSSSLRLGTRWPVDHHHTKTMASAPVVSVLLAATAVTISLVSTDVTGVVFAKSILFAKPDATETEHDLFVQSMDNKHQYPKRVV